MSVKVDLPDYLPGGSVNSGGFLKKKPDTMVPLLEDSYSSLETSVTSTDSLYAPGFSYISTVSLCSYLLACLQLAVQNVAMLIGCPEVTSYMCLTFIQGLWVTS